LRAALRTRVKHYRWDHLSPQQQHGAWDMIDAADAVTARRRRHRLVLLSVFVLVGAAADTIAAYVQFVAH
jgi:hypothetical protein